MRTKEKNKGFSLVELIVVMAIMLILAATLAPRLTHYIDKAKKASDQEAVNTIFNATKLSLADQDIYEDFIDLDTDADKTVAPYTIELNDNTNAYTVASKSWTISSSSSTNAFIKELKAVVGNFNLKSNEADGDTTINITVATDNTITVTLDYSGDSSTGTDDTYSVTE